MRCMQLTYHEQAKHRWPYMPYMLRIYSKMNSCIFDHVCAPCKLQSVLVFLLEKTTFSMKNNYNFPAKNAVITTPAAGENRLAIVHVRSPIMLLMGGRERGTDRRTVRQRLRCTRREKKWWGRLRQPTLSDHCATATHQNSVIMRQ